MRKEKKMNLDRLLVCGVKKSSPHQDSYLRKAPSLHYFSIMTKHNPPFLLCVLDGVGINPRREGNAVAQANTPTLDKLLSTCPHSTLLTHGEHVGLPKGQMGNSEVGHMAIGAGRILLQPLAQITEDLNLKKFAEKEEWKCFLKGASQAPTIHVVGLCSYGGVHSHLDHIKGMLAELNKTGQNIILHAITDGRDNAPKSAATELVELEAFINTLENVQIATICGRYTAMDRDKRWERTNAYYELIQKGRGKEADSIEEAIITSYSNNPAGDEFVQPTLIDNHTICNGDALLFANFRADRMRQIVRMFIDTKQNPKAPRLTAVATLTPYDESFEELELENFHVLYPPRVIPNTLGEVISSSGLTQLRIAETEKYPHVSYFFSGGTETEFKGESRKLVASPKVATYDLQPEMSLPEVTEILLHEIQSNTPDFIMLNMANGDMVGHTGDINAAIKSIEAVDLALGKLLDTIKEKGGEALILADHGNAEEMLSAEGNISTKHSTNPVPFIYVGTQNISLKNGTLVDVAPTVLKLLNLNKPKEMTGTCLTF